MASISIGTDASVSVLHVSVRVYECVYVKEGVFLEDQEMLVGGCQASEGSVEGRISVAFVRIYSHNKDLVSDTSAGCVYIKEASQLGAAASRNASGNAAAAVWRQQWGKVGFNTGKPSPGSVCDECVKHCKVHKGVFSAVFMKI